MFFCAYSLLDFFLQILCLRKMMAPCLDKSWSWFLLWLLNNERNFKLLKPSLSNIRNKTTDMFQLFGRKISNCYWILQIFKHKTILSSYQNLIYHFLWNLVTQFDVFLVTRYSDINIVISCISVVKVILCNICNERHLHSKQEDMGQGFYLLLGLFSYNTPQLVRK